ncbi:hypothetical protein CEG41_00690 [Ureaplasma parvum]|uniref:Mbov_0400 family ICE element protein n=1 Tax=Ureaplasma parvum TaxID=134821 RepID=UPI000B4DD566|nr:hypothetical protein [Ureaplasma parvum]ASD29221.1 hypothetical protein CEG41_00690 [Ureaplasma parvum]
MKVDKNDSILFKPVIFEKSIVFDLVGKQIESHPVIVFYDDTKNEYWYLGARSSYFFDKNTEKWEKKKPFEGEFEIKASESKGLFTKDTYVDTTKIYKIDKDLFHSLNIRATSFYNLTQAIGVGEARAILSCIHSSLTFDDVGIINVFLNKQTNKLDSKLEYCSEMVVDEVIKHTKEEYKEKYKIVVEGETYTAYKLPLLKMIKSMYPKTINPRYLPKIGEYITKLDNFISLYDSENLDIDPKNTIVVGEIYDTPRERKFRKSYYQDFNTNSNNSKLNIEVDNHIVKNDGIIYIDDEDYEDENQKKSSTPKMKI